MARLRRGLRSVLFLSGARATVAFFARAAAVALFASFVFAAIVSCSVAHVRPVAPSIAADVITLPPACLSVQERDRHVEFNGRELWLAESGSPRPLELNEGAPVDCERLEIVRGAHGPTVLIQFKTIEKGRAGFGITDRVFALASIRDAKWILEPVILDRTIQTRSGSKFKETASVAQDGATFIITDLKTQKKQTIVP